jgi:RNA polymerase-binding transcription factor DksA
MNECEHDSYTLNDKEESKTKAGVTILYKYGTCDLCGKKISERYQYLGTYEERDD